MTRIVLAVFLAASLVGCDKPQSAETKPNSPTIVHNAPPAVAADITPVVQKVEKTPEAEKTPDDARQYVQKEIDIYLGGKRSTDQRAAFGLDLAISHDLAGQPTINSITISSVLQSYSEAGEKEPNNFKVSLSVMGDNNFNKSVQITVMHEFGWSKKRGT